MKRLLFILLIPISLWCYEFQLCLTAMFQDEAPYLVEWVEYHKERGVEFFRLYNNNSQDNFREVLKDYIESGLVQIVEWPSVYTSNEAEHHLNTTQIGAYNHSIDFFRGKTKWLAIIDTDEFIFPLDESNLLTFLDTYYPSVSGLNINWQCFGTSGVERGEIIDGNVFLLGVLTKKMKWDNEHNGFCKSIVKPDHVSHCPSPHYCEFKNGHWGVNTTFKPTKGHCVPIEISKIRINHYWARDGWFFKNVKIPRQQRWGGSIELIQSRLEPMSAEEDTLIRKYLPLKCPSKP